MAKAMLITGWQTELEVLFLFQNRDQRIKCPMRAESGLSVDKRAIDCPGGYPCAALMDELSCQIETSRMGIFLDYTSRYGHLIPQ